MTTDDGMVPSDEWEDYQKQYGRKTKMTEKLSLTFYAAGVQFRKGWKETLSSMSEESMIKLVPEPTNKHDKNAVKIVNAEGVHVGYVPAKTGESHLVANALREEKVLVASIVSVEPDFEPWTALKVMVEEV